MLSIYVWGTVVRVCTTYQRENPLKRIIFSYLEESYQLAVNSPLIKGWDLEESSPFCARIVVTLILCISYHFCYNHSTTKNKVSAM